MIDEFEKLTGIKTENKSGVEIIRELITFLEGIDENQHQEIINAFHMAYGLDLDDDEDNEEKITIEEVRNIMIDSGATIFNCDENNGIVDAYVIYPDESVITLWQFTEDINKMSSIVYDFGQIHDLHEILNQYKK